MTKQELIESCATEQCPAHVIAMMLDAALIDLKIIDYEEIPDDMVNVVKAEIEVIKHRLSRLTIKI